MSIRPMKIQLWLLLFFISAVTRAQSGKDGAETISTTNVIFNRYDLLASSASVGFTNITVTNIANLSASAIAGASNNPYATNALGLGDLLMIIKMQGATMASANVANAPVNSNPPHTNVYGQLTAYSGTGTYELAQVQSVSGNVITLKSGLTNAFTVGGTQRVQVIRMPRLTSLTVNVGASLTGLAWSGSYTGGVVAIEVKTNATINGTITATGIGFRGGTVTIVKPLGGQFNQYDLVSTDINMGGEKGESIAGSQADYDAFYGGRYKRGAPANGGGGGNANCAGGGGGANAGISPGDTTGYKGWGNPDNAPASWSSAWNLESAIIGFSSASTSTGGGRGGYSYSGAAKNPITTAPATNTWSGDKRKIGGGWGGRPLLYTSTSLFMGGGGGAADADDQAGGGGGNGGGIVYLTVAGNVTGSGSIQATGANGSNTTGVAASLGRDGAGGGGGGGAVKLNVQGTITNISITVKGGKGGNQIIAANGSASETEGPGGGGGGGYIGVTGSPAITMDASGGSYGTTDSPQMPAFIANGATSGFSAGTVNNLVFVTPPDQFLPVRLECFDMVYSDADNVLINWTAYDEVNVLKYDLEQSTNLSNWTVLTTQPSQPGYANVKKYGLKISRPFATTYYRIKPVDIDGSFKYTCIKSVKASNDQKISISQSGNVLIITHPNNYCSFKMYNNSGQEMKINVTQAAGLSTIEKTKLPKGLYYLQINTSTTQSTHAFVNL
jgi:hypothetical protein